MCIGLDEGCKCFIVMRGFVWRGDVVGECCVEEVCCCCCCVMCCVCFYCWCDVFVEEVWVFNYVCVACSHAFWAYWVEVVAFCNFHVAFVVYWFYAAGGVCPLCW